jgi:hypothetical protein
LHPALSALSIVPHFGSSDSYLARPTGWPLAHACKRDDFARTQLVTNWANSEILWKQVCSTLKRGRISLVINQRMEESCHAYSVSTAFLDADLLRI